jgi:hypothetical protein
VIRVGVHRNGIVKIERGTEGEPVRLNAATAALFGPTDLKVERYLLHDLQLTARMSPREAMTEVGAWRN